MAEQRPDAIDRGPEGDERSGRALVVGVVAFGLLMALLPHLLWWGRIGEPTWVADNDELLYLAVAGRAYYEDPWRLHDPTTTRGGPTIYPWIQFGPAILVARALDLGPMGISIAWRVWAGLAMPAAMLLFLAPHVRRARHRAALAALVLFDAGMFWSRPLLYQALFLLRPEVSPIGALYDLNPVVYPQFRIITPGLSLIALAAHYAALCRAFERPEPRRIVLAALATGLLFWVYFYYWTAAGLAMGLALAVRPSRWRVCMGAGLGGLALGLPALALSWSRARAYSMEWLHRSDMFLPIPRTSDLLLPIFGLAALIACVVLIVWRRHRELDYLAALTVAGLLLQNSQVATGRIVQNFHWVYVWAPSLFLLIYLLGHAELIGRGSGSRPWPYRAALWGLVVALGASGLWLRAQEAIRTRQCREYTEAYKQYRDQMAAPEAPRLERGRTIAGDPMFLNFAAILGDLRPLNHYGLRLSAEVSDAQWEERIALNAVLQGLSPDEFRIEQERDLGRGNWGPWSRDPLLREERLVNRLRLYRAIARDPNPALDAWSVGYLALRSDQPERQPLDPAGWKPLGRGPTWTLWERMP